VTYFCSFTSPNEAPENQTRYAADSSHLQEHIEVILKHEAEFLTRRTAAERVGDFLTSIDDVAQSLKESMPSE
jgi:hypothetical protein